MVFFISILNRNHRWHARLRLVRRLFGLGSLGNLSVLLDDNVLLIVLLGGDRRVWGYSRRGIRASGRHSDRLVVVVERIELLVDVSFADRNGGILLRVLVLVRESRGRRVFFATAWLLRYGEERT